MKIRIYPKIRFLDSDELFQAVAPKEVSKKQINSLQNLFNAELKKYEQDPDGNYSQVVETVIGQLRNYLMPDREQWVEIKFDKFQEYFFCWFGWFKSEAVVTKQYIEIEVVEEELYRFWNFDYQINENGIWKSRS